MLPGFTALLNDSPAPPLVAQGKSPAAPLPLSAPYDAALASQGVTTAGFWDWLTGGDNSQGQRCNFDHTDTKCILFTMWCNNLFVCGYDRNNNVIRKDSGWYICGVCGNPFDW